MHSFINLTPKYLHCGQEMFDSAPIYNVDVKTFGGKGCQKLMSYRKKMSWCHARELSYTPQSVTWYVGYNARKSIGVKFKMLRLR